MSYTADDDEIEASRAPLLQHLIELRKRLVPVPEIAAKCRIRSSPVKAGGFPPLPACRRWCTRNSRCSADTRWQGAFAGAGIDARLLAADTGNA